MRYVILTALLLSASTTPAQTITSVQDGDWYDPTTWDCNCVPALQAVEILHTVQLTGNTKLNMLAIHVAAGAKLTMDAPHLLFMLHQVVNDGIMLLAGSVDVDGELYNNGIVQIDGDFLSHGLLDMGGWGTLVTAVNMEMGGTISGQGHICVSGTTVNYGIIQDEVDICDLSPTTATPPFIDNNTGGTVAATVTFCAGGVCSVGLPERTEPQDLIAWPNPADEQLTLEGLPPALTCTLTVRDAMGRIVALSAVRIGDRLQLDVAGLPAGIYSLLVSAPNFARSVRVVVDR